MDARTVLSVFVGGVLVLAGFVLAVAVWMLADIGGLGGVMVMLLTLLVEAAVGVAVIRARQSQASTG